MTVIVRGGVGLVGLVFLVLGLGFLLAPEVLAVEFHLQPVGDAGLNVLRGDFFAMFMVLAGFSLHGAVTGSGRYLILPAGMLCLVLFGRALGLVLDGISAPSLTSMGAEVVMIAILYAGYRRMVCA